MDANLFSLVAEKGIVEGAFLYLLWYFVQKNNKTIDSISYNLERFGHILEKVSDTLLRLDSRVESLEEKIKDLEGKK